MGQKILFAFICMHHFLRYEWKMLRFLLFFAKIHEIPYSHNVRNSIGNNSGSVEGRTVKFAYSRLFSET